MEARSSVGLHPSFITRDVGIGPNTHSDYAGFAPGTATLFAVGRRGSSSTGVPIGYDSCRVPALLLFVLATLEVCMTRLEQSRMGLVDRRMPRRTIRFVVGCVMAFVIGAPAAQSQPPAPEISTSDVDLFYRVYDAARGKPTIEELRLDYLGAGSDGLRYFIPHRIISASRLSEQMIKNPSVYRKARRCAAVLPAVRVRLATALEKLRTLLPDAKFPPVIFLIGRNSAGGTVSRVGVLVGIEAVCRANWMQRNLEDRLLYLVAHEYIHVQQPEAALTDDPRDWKRTVLQHSLVEGVAEFVGELISGSASNTHLQAWTRGREKEISAAFREQMNGTDMGKWLYNGVGTAKKPGDLGYWVGYHIAKCYYENAADKVAAVRALIELKDPQEILAGGCLPAE
jgi:hypothetical protein